jgi:hypothetical protein
MDTNSFVSFLLNACMSGSNSLLVVPGVVVVVRRMRMVLLSIVDSNTKASVLSMQNTTSKSACSGSCRR